MRIALLAAVGLALAPAGAYAAPTVKVSDTDIIFGSSVGVNVAGLTAGEAVRLQADASPYEGDYRDVGEGLAREDGTFVFRGVAPQRNTRLRAIGATSGIGRPVPVFTRLRIVAKVRRTARAKRLQLSLTINHPPDVTLSRARVYYARRARLTHRLRTSAAIKQLTKTRSRALTILELPAGPGHLEFCVTFPTRFGAFGRPAVRGSRGTCPARLLRP